MRRESLFARGFAVLSIGVLGSSLALTNIHGQGIVAHQSFPHVSQASLPSNTSFTASAPVVLNVINAYTPKALKAVNGNLRTIQDEFARDISYTNQAFANDHLPMRVRQVALVATSDKEPDVKQSTVMLNALDKSATPYASINQARQQFHTNMTMLMAAPNDGTAGEAMKDDDFDPQYTSGVIRSGDSTEVYVYAHELGHILGLDHDKAHIVDKTTGINKGYLSVAHGIGDIMSYGEYNCASKAVKTWCDISPSYSDPSYRVNGYPLGDSESNAVSYMRSHLRDYSNYSESLSNQIYVEQSNPVAGQNLTKNPVSVTFNENVVSGLDHIYLQDDEGSTVTSTQSYDSRTHTLSFSFPMQLLNGTYRIVIDAGVKNSSGNQVSPQTIPFTVGHSVSVVGAKDVKNTLRPLIEVGVNAVPAVIGNGSDYHSGLVTANGGRITLRNKQTGMVYSWAGSSLTYVDEDLYVFTMQPLSSLPAHTTFELTTTGLSPAQDGLFGPVNTPSSVLTFTTP